MENPHAERQAVLLERILKTTSKCTETIIELNHSLEEILRANAYVKTAADLSTKYRKNVQYNLEATKRLRGTEENLSVYHLDVEPLPAVTALLQANAPPSDPATIVYQQMIDRGWRRSGTWCYKPDLRYSCCPQYTIRLDALAFKSSKSQRKVVNRWNRYVLKGKDDETMDIDAEPKKTSSKSKNHTFSLTSAIHALETGFHTEEHSTHRFEVSLELSSYTQEKFTLYQKYQEQIHHDTHNTPHQFRSFLVDSPLTAEPIAYNSSPPPHLPEHYGSYHQLYRLDGELIAMAVLDILPHCVSSVYFMYDKKWEHFSFGKLSAMREIALVREIREAGAPEMSYLYMGFYIQSCQKMRYKGEYSPSYLADPETYQWYPLKDCIPLMEKSRYACFSDPSRSVEGDAEPDDDSYPSVSDEVMKSIRVKLSHDEKPLVLPVTLTNIMKYKELRTEVEDCVQGLGLQTSKEVIFTFEAS